MYVLYIRVHTTGRAQTSACPGMKTIEYLHHRFLHSDSWLSFKRLFYVFAVEKDIFVTDFLSKNRRGLCPTLSFVRKAISYFHNYMIDRMYNTILLAAHLCYFITIPSQLPAYNQNYIVFPLPYSKNKDSVVEKKCRIHSGSLFKSLSIPT